ncbi:hypothetical protein HZS38_10095 [Xenorhabdus nematophila]|nr:hypothetical protein [Xenorhabdus nematophila]MBA0019475.1 hypothetical protein [Xenorhabdus nematophila]QNJ35158.1 hypothetical protein H8F46_09865 [Xenorhabdus nematophila]
MPVSEGKKKQELPFLVISLADRKDVGMVFLLYDGLTRVTGVYFSKVRIG